MITVPNSELTANVVTNVALNERLRLSVPVRVNYDHDLDTVVRALAEPAADHPDVLDRPDPVVRVAELGETIEVVATLWIAEPDRDAYGRVRSEYARDIVGRLGRDGIDLGRANPQALEGEIGVVPKSGSNDETHGDRVDKPAGVNRRVPTRTGRVRLPSYGGGSDE